MNQLSNISINDQELKRILTKSFFSRGSEAVICRTGNPYVLMKIFIEGRLNVTPMSDNKLRKIEKIYQQQLEHSVRPLRTITNNGMLIGYEMSYNPNNRRFSTSTITRNKTIHHLENARAILKYFETKDIIYGDVDFRNILIDIESGAMTFCDVDNVCMGPYPIDFIPNDLTGYEDVRGIDSSTDAYLHNLLTLRALGLDPKFCDHDDIKGEFTESAIRVFETMQDIERFNGEYIIQYIKNKNF